MATSCRFWFLQDKARCIFLVPTVEDIKTRDKRIVELCRALNASAVLSINSSTS
jgi:hypothetical protein